MIKALIFDFDGTIVDTESPWYDLVLNLYHLHGQELPLAEYLQCIGTSDDKFDVYQRLEDLVGQPLDRAGIKADLSARHANLMKTSELRPGVLAIIQAGQRRGLPLGIASSSSRAWVDSYLAHFGIAGYFRCVLTSDDVERVKPDPELFIKARDALGCGPGEALVIEDSCYGLAAARAAGLPCVVVHNRLTVAMEFPGAARIFSDFREFNLDELLGVLG